ncbi:EXS family-domain-containing protein [Zychaea mexicana]|uniref:EXS family-domain-containing protein n=1 Tax=Zychaea mexicana TaxID=64656 RepID=UPI0022FE1823|nr:EXS family-domain-containing protein [Zychaea mexicana]KAI9498358.1 EXS family-domain-containing protein [Zychaea mexicana]
MDTDGGGSGTATAMQHSSILENILPAATYRPIVIFCIGLWGWGLNLYLLNKQQVDPAQLLQIHPVEKNSPIHKPVFALAGIVTTIIICNVWWYWIAPWHWTPILCYVFAILLILWPGKNLCRKERERFLRVLRRIVSFNLFSPVYFGDVILADILTSFSNVFGDLFSTCCSATTEDNPCYRDVLVPLLISLPYVIRLRQCLSEYIDSGGECKRHLWNALKYASAFPVILISASQKKADRWVAATGSVPSTWWVSDTNLFRLWIIFVFFNSMYSFWWDISVDWNLINVATSSRTAMMTNHAHQHHYLHYTMPIVRFRRHLHFNDAGPYFAAMVIDLILRTTWSLKLSSHLYVKRLEGSIFMMELLEVIRRWVWVIFRMESEWVKRTLGTLPTDNATVLAMDTLGNSANSSSQSKLMPIREEEDDDDDDNDNGESTAK